MKNVFIWVAKLILAILVILGVSYLLTGAEYLILSIFDYVSKTNYLSDFDSWDSFKHFLIVSCIVLAISKQMDDIKINKQPKGIYKLLAKWRNERNITNPDYRVYFQNIIEELFEPLGYTKEEISIIKIDIYNKYYPNELVLNENLVVDTICDIKVFSINELGTMKYNGKKCMSETIKEISSRQQDSFQKEIWDKNGASGKWLKSQEQSKDTLYVADYSKCKL